MRTGSPWRDLPEVFGDWNSVFRRFSRWSQKGVWWRIFEAMSDDPDFEYLIVDSTIVRAHQHAAGAKKRGLKIRSWAGSGPLPRRIEHQDPHGCARPGLPGPLQPHGGQRGDAPQADALTENLPAKVVMADAAYDSDSDRIRKAIAKKGAVEAIPTIRPAPTNTRSTSTSTDTGASSSAASPSSSTSGVWLHDTRRPRGTTSRS